jgi:hypothetical protein
MRWKGCFVMACVCCLLAIFYLSIGALAAGKKRSIRWISVSKRPWPTTGSSKAKKEQINQAEYVKNQARADFLPKLSTSYGYKRYGLDQEVFFQVSGWAH